MPPKSKAEIKYLKEIKDYRNIIHSATDNAVQEGFEFFASEEYKSKYPENEMNLKKMLLSHGPIRFFRMLKILAKYMIPMMKGRRECFTDLKDYFIELKENRKIENTDELLSTYPNQNIWKELIDYARNKWHVHIGFTEFPQELIFKGKAVLFNYVLVCIQEMKKEKIDFAPDLRAGEEVQRVYNSLGHAVNDIARWLRKKYDIKCQSNHPLGGLVNTPPLAGNAGMGWQGLDGLLITPQFGKRNRIAPIFIQNKIFEYTDNNEHKWIEEYCKKCHKCQKNCPTHAIYEKKIPTQRKIQGIGQVRTCIARIKCFPQFIKTLGCSICIKVCPFSKGNGVYDKIKEIHHQKA